jgi:SAM-dependent methyltransferase
MFSESAEFYDLIYSTFKDYRAEATTLASLLHDLHPGGRTVLDVACGTGEHARWLAAHGFTVDGIDLDPRFVEVAQQKHTAGRFFQADMADFTLPQRYDAILCLFSSIGYLKTLDRIEQALLCFRQHLADGGVILVEPWFQPDVLTDGRVVQNTGEAHGVRVTRTSRVEIEGRLSRLLFDYEITEGDRTRRAHEVHELGLFTSSEMKETFRRAGLLVKHDPVGLTDRGLYVARLLRHLQLEKVTA